MDTVQATCYYNEYFDMVGEVRKEQASLLPLEYELMKRMEALNGGKNVPIKNQKENRMGN